MADEACLHRQRRWGALTQSRKSISTTAIELPHLVLGLRAKEERFVERLASTSSPAARYRISQLTALVIGHHRIVRPEWHASYRPS